MPPKAAATSFWNREHGRRAAANILIRKAYKNQILGTKHTSTNTNFAPGMPNGVKKSFKPDVEGH
jgi:hypothetical protein